MWSGGRRQGSGRIAEKQWSRGSACLCNGASAEVRNLHGWTSELRDGWELRSWTQDNEGQNAEGSRAGLPSLCLEGSIAALRGASV